MTPPVALGLESDKRTTPQSSADQSLATGADILSRREPFSTAMASAGHLGEAPALQLPSASEAAVDAGGAPVPQRPPLQEEGAATGAAQMHSDGGCATSSIATRPVGTHLEAPLGRRGDVAPVGTLHMGNRKRSRAESLGDKQDLPTGPRGKVTSTMHMHPSLWGVEPCAANPDHCLSASISSELSRTKAAAVESSESSAEDGAETDTADEAGSVSNPLGLQPPPPRASGGIQMGVFESLTEDAPSDDSEESQAERELLPAEMAGAKDAGAVAQATTRPISETPRRHDGLAESLEESENGQRSAPSAVQMGEGKEVEAAASNAGIAEHKEPPPGPDKEGTERGQTHPKPKDPNPNQNPNPTPKKANSNPTFGEQHGHPNITSGTANPNLEKSPDNPNLEQGNANPTMGHSAAGHHEGQGTSSTPGGSAAGGNSAAPGSWSTTTPATATGAGTETPRPDDRMPITAAQALQAVEKIARKAASGTMVRPVRNIPMTQRRAALSSVIVPRLARMGALLKGCANMGQVNSAVQDVLRVPRDIAMDPEVEDAAAAKRKPLSAAAKRWREMNRMGDQEEIPNHIKRAAKAVQNDDLKKAMSALMGEPGLADMTPKVMMVAASKHPTSDPVSAVSTAWDTTRVPNIRTKLVRRIVRRAKRGRAAGPSGWTWELLQYVASSKEGITALTSVVNGLATGLTDPHMGLLTCNLTLLNKKPSGVRPVAVAEPIVSLTSKCLAAVVESKMRKRFAPFQFAGGLSRGIPAAILAVKTALADRRGSVLMSLDCSNAFNECHRSPMLAGIKQNFPEVYPFMVYMYGKATPLSIRGANVLQSQAGQRQGDALSMLAFCEVLHPVILESQKAADVAVIAYADDVKVVGSRDACLAFEKAFAAHCAKIGLRANPDKTEWYDPSTDFGTEVFGAPVGTRAFRDKHAADKMKEICMMADACADLSDYGFTQAADQLLRRSVRASLEAYLQVAHVEETRLSNVSNHLLRTFWRIVGERPGWELLSPRPKDGGLAFRPATNVFGQSQAKALEAMVGFGVTAKFLSNISPMEAFDQRLPRSIPEAVALQKPPKPARVERLMQLPSPFTVLPAWVNSVEQHVEGGVYLDALLLHIGVRAFTFRRVKQVVPTNAHVRQQWIGLGLQTPLPESGAPGHMLQATKGLAHIPILHISFAYMRDVVESHRDLARWAGYLKDAKSHRRPAPVATE